MMFMATVWRSEAVAAVCIIPFHAFGERSA